MAEINMTDPKRIPKVLACFKEVGLRFEIGQFDSRLMAQKVVFLAQRLGVDLGYRDYNFYLRGTYSRALTKDLFAAQSQGLLAKPSPASLSEKDQERLSRLKETTDLRPAQLEVMAGYEYLREKRRTNEQALAELKIAKPFLSEREIAIGVSKCKRLFPQVSPSDIESLRQEMDPWERATSKSAL